MAKSRPDRRGLNRKKQKNNGVTEITPEVAQSMLEEATALLQTGQAQDALPIAKKVLRGLLQTDTTTALRVSTYETLGEIYIELGDVDEARQAFGHACSVDPDGVLPDPAIGGADKFLWLAQLSDQGGLDSVQWFEKGCTVLRREISQVQQLALGEDAHLLQKSKKGKLANALCGAAEVYMTDLSWEEDAETRCEALVTEACMIAPDSPEPYQTLASVRISQTRMDDARAALRRSLELWTDLPPEHEDIPDFPTRISLTRLLMEAELEEEAMDVLERLVAEDDSSVEAWYLGGWCLNLLAKKHDQVKDPDSLQRDDHKMDSTKESSAATASTDYLRNSRTWLSQSLNLYDLLDYEDDRLHDHAQELIDEINEVLGPAAEDDGEDEWVDAEDEELDSHEDGEGHKATNGHVMNT